MVNAIQQKSQPNVLIIDHDAGFISEFSSQLQGLIHCSIDVVADLSAVLEKVTEKTYQVALCNLDIPDTQSLELVSLLNRHDVSILGMTATYSEEIHSHMTYLHLSDYVVQDSHGAIEYASDLTKRLIDNQQRPLWVLSLSHFSASKLLGLLKYQRFPLSVFESLPEINRALGLGSESMELFSDEIPQMILLTGVSNPLAEQLVEWLNQLRETYSSHVLPIVLCGRPEDLRIALKLIKYGVNDFYNLHFSVEELYIKIERNLPKF